MPKKTTKTRRPSTPSGKKADYYDEDQYNYLHYWRGREYEHAAEEIAIKRLLRGKHFKHAADIGGGYGRLCLLLEKYADEVTLAEPSEAQLEISDAYLKDKPNIKRLKTQADNLKFSNGSLDLVTVIRVMHHLPDPASELKEFARVLSDDGYLILEVANFAHARNRIRFFLRGQRLPNEPVDIRSAQNKKAGKTPFVNHNPKTVIKQLAHAGLKVEKVLSVSNLRSPKLKKIVPKTVMLAAEKMLQSTFSKAYFGPSVFFLVKKAK
jgi:ubiquinone/menaquinone biosynthesis C-methylase UbiE